MNTVSNIDMIARWAWRDGGLMAAFAAALIVPVLLIGCGSDDASSNGDSGLDAAHEVGTDSAVDGGSDAVAHDVVKQDAVTKDVTDDATDDARDDGQADDVHESDGAKDVNDDAPDVQPDVPSDVQLDTPADVHGDTDALDAPVEAELWLDPDTGLLWQKPGSMADPGDPQVYCEGLTYGGYDDWRLPTIDELRTLIRGCDATKHGGACNVGTLACVELSCRDEVCNGCVADEGPSSGCYWPEELSGECGPYWSSTEVTDTAGTRWHIDFASGGIRCPTCFGGHYVRCVTSPK